MEKLGGGNVYDDKIMSKPRIISCSGMAMENSLMKMHNCMTLLVTSVPLPMVPEVLWNVFLI